MKDNDKDKPNYKELLSIIIPLLGEPNPEILQLREQPAIQESVEKKSTVLTAPIEGNISVEEHRNQKLEKLRNESRKNQEEAVDKFDFAQSKRREELEEEIEREIKKNNETKIEDAPDTGNHSSIKDEEELKLGQDNSESHDILNKENEADQIEDTEVTDDEYVEADYRDIYNENEADQIEDTEVTDDEYVEADYRDIYNENEEDQIENSLKDDSDNATDEDYENMRH